MADASQSLANEAAKRYASALFELAQDGGALSDVNRDFAAFTALIAGNADLERLIQSPAFSRDDKSEALVALAAEAGAGDLVKKFLGTMAANGRARDIPAAQRAFDALYANQRGVKRAVARTAKPMSADQRTRLEAILAKVIGGEVELSEEVDERLIGGIQLRVGSTLVDASLAAKIDRMNSAMKGA
ncbi:MAG: ATP synthase F1 subunit delta [Pseudomonadota bacterium]